MSCIYVYIYISLGSIGDHVEHTKIQEERTKLASRQSRRTAMTKIPAAWRAPGSNVAFD